jgi:hypothetical protein
LEDRRLLAVFSVTNLNDALVAVPGDAPGTLRQAIFDANAAGGADTIDFGVTTGTINLTYGHLAVIDSVTISGPGAANFTISAGNLTRIFEIDDLTPRGSYFAACARRRGVRVIGNTGCDRNWQPYQQPGRDHMEDLIRR